MGKLMRYNADTGETAIYSQFSDRLPLWEGVTSDIREAIKIQWAIRRAEELAVLEAIDRVLGVVSESTKPHNLFKYLIRATHAPD